ncbi:MAG TPA: mechanosensitive ion channel domain-containing protein [Candidatus Saccharimonadales bacterium]|nr:mechanosensitive ion channel domain-containing protein [Candidatus Saccharimonadales bacterium]
MEITTHSPTIIAILKILLVIIASLLINTALRAAIRVPKKLETRRGRTYLSVVRSLVSVVIFSIGLYIIFVILEIDITPLLASAGIVGIAIGIGARSLIEDIIAGLFLITQTTTAIGDYVIVGGNEGIIEHIGFRNITIRSINGAFVTIPNGQVKQVVNYSWGNAVLFIDIPVKAGQDIDVIIDLLTVIIVKMQKDEKAEFPIKDGSEVLGIENFQTGSCILVRVMLITVAAGRNVVERNYRYKVVKSFEKNKIIFA